MKKALLAIMVSAAFMPALVQAATIANNGTLTISGQVNPVPITTCSMVVSGGTDAIVTLAPVPLEVFSAVSSASSYTQFTLVFTNCPSAMADSSIAQLTLNGNEDPDNGNTFQNTGTATGVGIQIEETTNAVVMRPGIVGSGIYTVTGGTFSVPMQTAILRTSGASTPVTTGTVIATPTVRIDYQ